MASQDLTPEALEGFAAQLDGKPAHEACPHYTSSPAGMAWLVGAWLQKTGCPAPRNVRMLRGYTVRVGDRLIAVSEIWPANIGVRANLTLAGSSGNSPLHLGT